MNPNYLHREAQALAEAGKTKVTPAQKRFLALVFLGAIFFAPLSQQIIDVHDYLIGERKTIVPQCYDILGSVFSAITSVFKGDSTEKPLRLGPASPSMSDSSNIFTLFGGRTYGEPSFSAESKGGPLTRLLSANRQLLRDMHAYEDALEDNSLLGRTIRPYTQYVMARWFGAGNDKAYCGRNRWLFYSPDVDYVVNHGFLREDIMARRAADESETRTAPQPDPRKAVLAFNNELAKRGIKLILMPTPVKPVIQPEKFAAGFEGYDKPVHNSSYAEFVRDMEKQGIPVFDAASALVQEKRTAGHEQFLVGDTHWRPQAMELCARLLSAFIRDSVILNPDSHEVGMKDLSRTDATAEIPRSDLQRVGTRNDNATLILPAIPSVGYTAVRTNIIHRGDIVAMLCLPQGAKEYGPESVEIRRILQPDGKPWQADSESEILVLGDSFCNIYSLEALGWGTSAGLVEQLSYEMGRKIDWLAVNDNGAWATRELLRKEILRGKDRLAGKRVVVWQFAERELSYGDWKLLPLDISGQGRAGQPCPAGPAASSGFIRLEPGSQLVIRGRIEKISRGPKPRSVPYADHIITAHLTDVADSKNNQLGQALVYLFSMTNNILTKAAGLKAGDTVELKLRPWSDVSATYERINRADLDDEDFLFQEPCWGEILPEGK